MTSSIYNCSLSAELLKKAREELSENPETRSEDVQCLRERVLNNKALKCPVDGGFLLRFLRARKFDQERAYDLLISYYALRAEKAVYFKNFNPSGVLDVLDSNITMVLPQGQVTEPRVLYFRPGHWDPEQFTIWEVFRTNIISMEHIIKDEAAQVNGMMVILDCADIDWSQVRHFDTSFAGLITKVMQDAFPCRLKGIQVVNEASFFSVIFAIVKPFLKTKMASRIHLHSTDLESLHKEVNIDCLPEELGGSLGPADLLYQAWNQQILADEETYREMSKYSLSATRDITGGLSEESIAGVSGTYKKLNID